MDYNKPKYLRYIVLILIIFSLLIYFLKRRGTVKFINYKSFKPLQNITIVIDPGHGGIDSGTKHEDLLEKDINLALGLGLRDELVKKGASCIMTREEDKSLEGTPNGGSRHSRDLKARVKIIEESQCDIFISVHVNHIKNTKPLGSIVFYNEDREDSQYLASYIQENLNRLSEYENMGIELNRIPLPGDYYILNNSKDIGVLIETGFISNEWDRKLLLDDNHQKELIQSIVKGIFQYLKLGIDNK